MGGKTISTSDTKIEALTLQSSAYGVTIAVVGGVTRIAGNLIYQTDFVANPTTTTQGGKGGGTKVQNTTYTYATSLLMALCHGQITGIPNIWVGKKKYSDDNLGGGGTVTVNTATESFSVAGGGGTATVAHAAAFSANVSVSSSNSGYVGEDGVIITQYAEGVDYTVKNGVYTFGSSFPGATVSITYQYTSTGAGSTALSKLGITLMPGSLTQAAPSWVTSRHPSDALSYAGLAYVSADAYSLGTGAQVENHNFEVVGPGAYSLGPSVPDIDPSGFAVKMLQDARYGAAFPSAFMDVSTLWSSYCLANNLLMSPALTTQVSAADFLSQMATLTNTGLVWSGSLLRFVPYGDVAATGNGATYTPNVTPIYDLSDDAYIVQAGEAPVKVHRKKQSDAYNHIRVQFKNRLNDYAPEIAEAKDQADIEANGLRSAQIVQADWICDGNVARNVAQLMLQRSVHVRATYEFTLPYNFACLEPMDLVTLTDAGLGLNKAPVRITSVTENSDELQFEAEEFALGVANAALYGTQIGSGFWNNFNAAPGSALAPVIFEAPAGLSSSGLEVMVAATGTGANWGGCRVWVSMDGTNYREAGKISGGSRFGKLTSTIGSTVGVLLNTGALTSGSAADSAAYQTLCYVGGATPEYFAFQTATLTGAEAYTLGGLTRGGYGTTGTNAHAINDAFVRVDESVANSGPLDFSMIGKTIHVKLTSFNFFGLAEESLASVTDYTYTITGAMTQLAPSTPTSMAYTIEGSGVRFSCAKNPELNVIGYEWRIGASGGTWSTATVLDKLGGTSELWSTATAGSYTVYVAAVDKFGNESAQATLNVTLSATDLGPNAPAISLAATGQFFLFDNPADTSGSGPTITFTATPVNASGTVTWSAQAYNASGSPIGSVTIGTAGNTATMTAVQFESVSALNTHAVKVTATLGSLSASATVYRNDGGTDGNQYATARLYEWAATQPGNPSGSSTWTWSSSALSGYGGTNGWSATVPANPGTAGYQLWVAEHQVVDTATATTTTVTWSTGTYTVTSRGANGTNGSNGNRGSFTGNGFQYGIRTNTWDDTLAQRVIENMNTGATLTTGIAAGSMTAPGLILGDTVTLGNGNPWWTTLGTWSSATAYVQNDIVISSGVAYRASQASTNKTPASNPTYWTSLGTATSRSAWAASTAYAPNDYVTSSGTTYLAKWKHTSDATSIANDLATVDVAITKYWGGTSWLAPGVVIDGNLLVKGTLSADKIYGKTLSGVGISIGPSAEFQVDQTTGQVTAAKFTGYASNFGNTINPSLHALTSQTYAGGSGDAGRFVITYASGASSGCAITAISNSDQSTSHAIRGTWNKFGTSSVPARGTNNAVYSSGLVGANNGNAFYAEAGTIGPFTASHEVAIPPGMEFDAGDIVVDTACLLKAEGFNDTLWAVRRSARPKERGAIGIITYIVGPMDRITLLAAAGGPGCLELDEETGIVSGPPEFEMIKDHYLIAQANAVGEGQMNVCGEGGSLRGGDLIVTSSMPGKGMRQNRFGLRDPVIRGHTVARVRGDKSVLYAFDGPRDWRAIPVIFISG